MEWGRADEGWQEEGEWSEMCRRRENVEEGKMGGGEKRARGRGKED